MEPATREATALLGECPEEPTLVPLGVGPGMLETAWCQGTEIDDWEVLEHSKDLQLENKLYSIVYAITVVPVFPPLPPSTQLWHSLRQSSHHCPCLWVLHICSLATLVLMLYLPPHDYSVTTNLYFLIPSHLSPMP